jgi:hypothetical protein
MQSKEKQHALGYSKISKTTNSRDVIDSPKLW